MIQKYPDLSGSKIIAADIEGKDPTLSTLGPGVRREGGYILGVALANEQGFKRYYSFAHKETPLEERQNNKKFVRDVLALPVQKVGANFLYDLDWLCNGYGYNVEGKLHDVLIAEPLLDEYAIKYNLDRLAKKYLKKSKKKNKIEEFCEANRWKGDFREHLYKVPLHLVDVYAAEDADLCIPILRAQLKEIEAQGLSYVYGLESDLLRVWLLFLKTGVRVSPQAIKKAESYLTKQIERDKKELFSKYGEFNYNSGEQMAPILDVLGFSYPLTKKTKKPSVTNETLEHAEHPDLKKLVGLRKADKLLNTFIRSTFAKYTVKGRIHTSFNPLRSDNYGTVSGRLSSSNPNLQQVPKAKKDKPSTLIARSCFIPEEGCLWGSLDYSQIEYMIIAHFAIGPKSEDIRKLYCSNPGTDYHKLIMTWTGLERKEAKTLNFGTAFYMGAATMARKYGYTLSYAQELLLRYFTHVPFMKPTRESVRREAIRKGFITTLLGRRGRVSTVMKENRKEYQLFNRKIQGSAADVMKKATLDIYKAGVFSVLPPHLTVHDELDVSVPKTKPGLEAFAYMEQLMINTVKLSIPLRVSAEIGNSWADSTDNAFNKEKLLKLYGQG